MGADMHQAGSSTRMTVPAGLIDNKPRSLINGRWYTAFPKTDHSGKERWRIVGTGCLRSAQDSLGPTSLARLTIIITRLLYHYVFSLTGAYLI
jgi:hypothetical protein